jgi:hypothetical protein
MVYGIDMQTRSVDDKLADLRQLRDDIALLERAIKRRDDLVVELLTSGDVSEAVLVENSGLKRAMLYRKAQNYRDRGLI